MVSQFLMPKIVVLMGRQCKKGTDLFIYDIEEGAVVRTVSLFDIVDK